MAVVTLAHAEARFPEATYLDHLDRDAEIPTVTTLAAQGDVLVLRQDGRGEAGTAIPASGAVVVRGENGGNTHALFGDGRFDALDPSPTHLDLGVLTVPADATVLLSHPEHGGLLIMAGTWVLRRQREQADELRLVAD